MKKLACMLLTAAALMMQSAVYAAPSCIMMRFTDDTKFDKLDSAGTLSDLLLEKLLESGEFNFKETQVIPEDIAKLLYDEKGMMFQSVNDAIQTGNFNSVFEGAEFDPQMADSIVSAEVGQYVSPGIIRRIGTAHGADYLIQGTILNLGSGKWVDSEYIDNTGRNWGSETKSVLAVQADVKLIKAETGEVVWKRTILTKEEKTGSDFLGLQITSSKLTEETYYKAINRAAGELADALISDMRAGQLFIK